MNINSDVKRILCFGDSLTYGANPKNDDRFGPNERWTGILQNLLGDEYDIIEEGLGGRTTNVNDPHSPYRNGFTYFKPCFLSHLPLFATTLLLGTNDLKNRFNRSASQISEAMEKYFKFIETSCTKENQKKPIIIFMSPPMVNESEIPTDWDFNDAERRSKELPIYFGKLANKYKAKFLDLGKIVNPSSNDGVHLDEKSNKILAKNLYDLISEF